MKYFFTILFTTITVLALNQICFAIDELTVKVPGIYESKPGYIDESVLVVEPHGGYSEQSLYLKYSDHAQFSKENKVEIIHRFELPEGSVVNDLWLWIGDSVMKAIMLDTWKARSIYDSIVSMKRDPAFLTKKGNQYELHIYPLTPGSFRKIKLNFITPTRWNGNNAVVELPLKMLQDNNNTKKPLNILFREKENIWGNFRVDEFPQLEFIDIIDTAGYHYKKCLLADISGVQSLKLSYGVNFSNGTYFSSNSTSGNLNYFQLALSLKEAFNLKVDSSSKKNVIGLDLSGSFNKDYATLIPNLKKILKSSLKENDFFNFFVSGAGRIKNISDSWIPATQTNIDNILNNFQESRFADSIAIDKIPNLIYCDDDAATCWGFTDLGQIANSMTYNSIAEASGYFSNADIVASYSQGYENIPTASDLEKIIPALDQFFLKGGRFLTYFDFNRDGKEKVASHYIKGLITKSRNHNSLTLYRNPNGNIGLSFPELIDHSGTYFLSYDNPDVKVELMDKDGNPAVISKKVGNGLIVVSGIWSFNDDAPLKKLLGVPLLGLNVSKNYSQLLQLLDKIRIEYNVNKFDKSLIISNSDTLILKTPAENLVKNYLSSFAGKKPVLNSINLLDGVFSSVNVNNIDYYGSGYFLKALADSTSGSHFETHISDWDLIASILSPLSVPGVEQLEVKAFLGDSQIEASELREIIQEPVNNNSPKFFIGSAGVTSELNFNVKAKFAGNDSIYTKNFLFPVSQDTSNKEIIIPSMLGYEKLKDLFANSSYDTTGIIKLALKYNLLCDYTSLIALEPNDTIHFLQDPLDEGGLITTDVNKTKEKSDSLELSVYPNPFNSQTRIVVNLNSPSRVNIYVFNILGQLVASLAQNEEFSGKKVYSWNGKNTYNGTVSSGIYLLRIETKDNHSGKETLLTRKLIMLK